MMVHRQKWAMTKRPEESIMFGTWMHTAVGLPFNTPLDTT